MIRLTVIIPTICRPTLLRALDSCRGADDVLVAPDGPEPLRRVLALTSQVTLPCVVRVLSVGGPHRDHGHTPANAALAEAAGDWLLRLDDDDAYCPGALALVRATLADAERVPHLWRAGCRSGVVWHTRGRLECGNVTTAGIAVPRTAGRLARYGTRYEGDYDYALAAVDLCGGRAVWRDEVIAGPVGQGRAG